MECSTVNWCNCKRKLWKKLKRTFSMNILNKTLGVNLIIQKRMNNWGVCVKSLERIWKRSSYLKVLSSFLIDKFLNILCSCWFIAMAEKLLELMVKKIQKLKLMTIALHIMSLIDNWLANMYLDMIGENLFNRSGSLIALIIKFCCQSHNMLLEKFCLLIYLLL